ncbi:ABC transporter permease [Streptomyces scopuliridis]|uniref:ABC transporter permease n=1 Tax=Streptomyces scopuliridis TaxID=452529 RepID=A0ACD4ZTG4_9ACTN|nr:ABC transporter permease [Streptomyces scopuliridis]WSC01092.1 ABC transporter permease [Streptomyces scopuliridis]WSC05297.1 ABC transporter permease [Streptomyces scopuliridis]
MAGFIFLRAVGHRLLLAAALLAVVLTTSVLAALTAFSGSLADTALRETLRGRGAASAVLVISADVPLERSDAAQEAAARGARQAFDGLPVTLRKLESSGTYALPTSLQAAGATEGKPDLTHFAALDRSRITLVSGAWPGSGREADGGAIPVALPEVAATQLKLRAGASVTLTDRLAGTRLAVRVTGVYKATNPVDPYWRLDTLGGRGVRDLDFTTYGPLLTDPAVLASGAISHGNSAWVATADYRSITTDRIGALRTASTRAPALLREEPALGDSTTASTALPSLLDRTERALLVSRSTLLIVALQLLLLAGYALLLVARVLGAERAGETALLRARGASRRRLAALAVTEALLLAAPAALCAPLLSAPLTGLFVRRSALGDGAGGRFGEIAAGPVWLVSAAVAVCCAAAVVSPALAATAGPASGMRRGRAAALPGPVRAGADVGLLLIAAVAYWQLDQQTRTSGGGALSGDREGVLGVDPLMVMAPALALLAGTVLTLRLLPPAARLAERRAASGRGLTTALAGWHFSRGALRGAGPVLLLVLAVAMGMLAIGQSASWDRSQRDQADFGTGASVRVLDNRPAGPGQAGLYASLPGVRQAAPAHRTVTDLSGGRKATVLALDTAHADERMLMRGDLADEPVEGLLRATAPRKAPARAVVPLPDGTRRLALDVRIENLDVRIEKEEVAPGRAASGFTPELQVTVEDRYGIPYRIGAATVPVDGRAHRVVVDLDATASGTRGAPAGPLGVTGFRLDGEAPAKGSERHRLSVERLLATGSDGAERPVSVPGEVRWRGSLSVTENEEEGTPTALSPVASRTAPLTVSYTTGSAGESGGHLSVQLDVARPAAREKISAVATDGFLRASGAGLGDSVDLSLAGEQLRVTIVKAVRELPTTGSTVASGGGAGPVTTAGESDAADGGALLVDLRAVNEVLTDRASGALAPNEWWLSTAPGASANVASALRARPDSTPGQVLVRDEVAAGLSDDPLGSGPRSALMAVAVAAAALAAVGFAVSAVGSLREQSAELSVLRALGASRRSLARLVATKQGLLIGIGLLAGAVLGTLLTRAVVPLVVLTAQAAQPVPRVLVELPVSQVALFLAGVAAVPVLITAAIAVRRADPVGSLRHQGDN